MIKPYTNIHGIIVSSDIYKKAYIYTHGVTPTKDTVYKHQNNYKKKEEDAMYGKMCEYAAYQILKLYCPTVSKPDFVVYDIPSWDSDLKNFFGVDIAVKSQGIDSLNYWGLGWVFQDNIRQREYRKDPVLDNGENWVCFVLRGNLTQNNELKCFVFPLYQVKDFTYRSPKKELVGDKRIVDGTKLQGIDLNIIKVLSEYL